ncbi:MAG: glycoside hydrolase family protein [Saprospiraceae bacterium]|nr:glycoside hydrolase family protein [Saprospiraceae bacterium]MBK9688178.1 glycoside hydrolase family protein [Saprospiraceae bacterium]
MYAPYKFTGKESDPETDLTYFGARYYDAALGIWLGVDPLAEKYPAISPFTYVVNNPIRLVDPNGMEVEGDIYNRNGVNIGNDGKQDQKVFLLNTDSDKQLTQAQALEMTTTVSNVQGVNPCANVCFDGAEMSEVPITNDQLNIDATLATIRESEGHGTPTSYNSQYGGGTIDSYDNHPNEEITKWDKTSTAAGAYQFLYKTWKAHSSKLGLTDFSPASQDRAAMYEMGMVKGAMDKVKSGQYNLALKALSVKWTSLPGGIHQWKSNLGSNFLNNRALILSKN